ncbi:MAG: DNA topoisomerase I [Lysobacterales bacterium]
MAKNLLIVESPAKAKTNNKYLGRDFTVLASYGHVRDLVPREGAVDTDRGFAMRYELIEKNERHVEAIAKAARAADALYLATDLDREGEAISWHIVEILRERGLLQGRSLHRVVFSEITPKAVLDAVAHPRAISQELVNAQQARRALDYLVGFNLSPVLWRKVQTGLSAGRVQSPALRMIVEREIEIEAFIRQEYWTIAAACAHPVNAFDAKLTRYAGNKVEQFSFTNGEQAEQARQTIADAAGGKLLVSEVQSKQRQRRPAPPFTTSTLQQEAARKLGFGTSRTMRLAQGLYEGVALGSEGLVGLITYMRTDSVSLGVDAVTELRSVIESRFGKKALPATPNVYKTKSKNAQEAHEAIRPTSALHTPEAVAAYLNPDQLRLYELIWKRTLASQMAPALMNTVSVDLAASAAHGFRATGTTVVEPGFLAVYEEGRDQKSEDEDDEARRLPLMKKGDVVPLERIVADQHFTEPPPRFSEASLVKALEEYGIGRPSTYASIIQTLLGREYVLLDNRRFRPTDVGRVVARFLSTHFTRYVDYDFTAKLEDDLDAVSRGEQEWVPLLEQFWKPFKSLVGEKMETVSLDEAKSQRVLGNDPASGKPISVRLGRFGPFAQIGNKDDEDKPRFASLLPGQSLHTITLEQALVLFKLPRDLGLAADGVVVSAGMGRFGPFVKHGSSYASIKSPDDAYTIELPRALELLREKQEAIANRVIASFDEGKIQILRGKFGPYITDGEKNGRIPKDREPETLSREECVALLAVGKPVKRRTAGKGNGRKARPATKKAAAAKAPEAKKTAVPKTPAKKAAAKKAPAKKAAAKKAPAGKRAASKAPARKVVSKAANSPGAVIRKAPARKAAAP